MTSVPASWSSSPILSLALAPGACCCEPLRACCTVVSSNAKVRLYQRQTSAKVVSYWTFAHVSSSARIDGTLPPVYSCPGTASLAVEICPPWALKLFRTTVTVLVAAVSSTVSVQRFDAARSCSWRALRDDAVGMCVGALVKSLGKTPMRSL